MAGINQGNIDTLVAAFAVAPKEVRAALKPGFAAATTLIAERVKANASFSTYIPGAVSESLSVTTTGVSGVVRIAERGGEHGGEVRVFEGNGLTPTEFEHPVFGNPWYVKQSSHPFAGPAVLEEETPATALALAAVESALLALFG